MGCGNITRANRRMHSEVPSSGKFVYRGILGGKTEKGSKIQEEPRVTHSELATMSFTSEENKKPSNHLPRKSPTSSPFKKEAYKSTTLKLGIGKLVTERTGPIESRYLLKEPIGKGGFGEVRKIQDKITNQLLAMKVIPKKNINPHSSSSIANEVEILKKLDHPNIIKLYEFAQDDESYYLITELCTGGELFDRIITMKNFSELAACQIIRSVLSAIAYCHNMKIVHRDLKPENLLFDSKGEDAIIKVIDFGTSMLFGKASKMNQRFGTVYFVAPEVLSGNYDEKCDVWSCGVVLYILLCGYPPFNGNSWDQILAKVKKGRYSLSSHCAEKRKIGKGWEHISLEAKMLVRRMLEYNPAKRISAEEALNDKWILSWSRKSTVESIPIKSTLTNLQSFKVQTALQQLVMAFIANRLQGQDEQKRLRNEFAKLDVNGDGILQKEELVAAYTKLGKSPLEAREIVEGIMSKIDINNNGTIDFSEFLTANLTLHEAVADKRLVEAFKLFDKDGNGQITLAELKEILGVGKEDTIEIYKILQEVDSDGDGQISYPEFKNMMIKLYKK